jgi:hypothetical protein
MSLGACSKDEGAVRRYTVTLEFVPWYDSEYDRNVRILRMYNTAQLVPSVHQAYGSGSTGTAIFYSTRYQGTCTWYQISANYWYALPW